MSLALIIVSVYAVVATIMVVMIIRMSMSRTLTTFDYNNVILKKTSFLYFDLNGFLMSDRDMSNNGHVLGSLQPGDHISSYDKIKDLNTYMKTCIKHRGNVTYKVEENYTGNVVKRVDLIFSPLLCGGRINGVMVISQEMYSKNREAELLEKTRELSEFNDEASRKIDKLAAERAKLENDFKKSSKHSMKLQKAMFQVEQKKAELESAIDIINKQKEELERVNVEIRKSNKMKETFLANTSHEIRTPLNAIIGFTNLLLKTSLTESQLKYLKNIKVSGNNLLAIINDILDMSKIEAGKMDLESVGFNIREMVETCVGAVNVKRDDKKVSIDIKIDNDVPDMVSGDPFRINQVLTNLLNNSIKFTGEVCLINLSVNLVQMDAETVELKFTVCDNGIGIPKDKQAEIFQSFTQANKDTTRKYGGTGLGLSITKQLVEMYGGNITVESELGKGSTFIFNLILKRAIDNVSSDKQSKPVQTTASLHILLVEDNDINQQLAVDTLMSWNPNLVIDIAGNGQIAVDKVKSATFDLVLMDIQMPVMDGNSAARVIRSLPYPKCDVPIIAMTAHAFKEEQERCLSNGMNDYVMKPFDPDDLCAKICKYTGADNGSSKVESESPADESFSLDKLVDICSGDYTELKRVIDVYERNVPSDIDDLLFAYQGNNMEQVKLKLHSLNTTFGYLEMTSTVELLGNLSKIMETEGADVSIPLSKISGEWERIVPQIKERLLLLKA